MLALLTSWNVVCTAGLCVRALFFKKTYSELAAVCTGCTVFACSAFLVLVFFEIVGVDQKKIKLFLIIAFAYSSVVLYSGYWYSGYWYSCFFLVV